MALSEKIKEIIGALTDSLNPMNPEDYEEEMDNSFDAEYPMDNNAALKPSFTETNPIRKSRANLRVLPQAKAGAHEVIVVEPKAYNESITIVEALKDRKTVILNLQLLDREQSQRIVDFLCGCTHALGGSQRKIGENVFIFTPSNINISQEFMNSKLSTDAMWTKA
ncbi:MAG: cell division protein SepF [Cyanobacteria bacterium SIG27]|nr:cell division protein SepF [Cyanobacteria bacterium SIG27]MBQ9150138.1 cell division protein SepF [bacterium]